MCVTLHTFWQFLILFHVPQSLEALLHLYCLISLFQLSVSISYCHVTCTIVRLCRRYPQYVTAFFCIVVAFTSTLYEINCSNDWSISVFVILQSITVGDVPIRQPLFCNFNGRTITYVLLCVSVNFDPKGRVGSSIRAK